MDIIFNFSALLVFQNKTYYMFFHSKEMAVSLNGSYNINYAAMPIFFKIIILPNTILDSFLKYLYLFS